MKNFNKIIVYFLVLIDIFSFYFSLTLLILIRYGLNFFILKEHLITFTFILTFWILGFYSNNLYNTLINKKIILNTLKAFVFGAIISILFFYLNPFLKITPKTNLLIFLIFYFSLFIIFRQIFYNSYLSKYKLKIALIAPIDYQKRFLSELSKLDFLNIVYVSDKIENLKNNKEEKIDLVLISRKIAPSLNFKNINFDTPIMEIVEFYEKNLGLIPLEEIDEYWILKEIINPEHKIQSIFKRVLDIVFSILILVITLPLIPFIVLGIYINSPGPIFFKQKRVGKNGKIFTLIKFRTMRNEKDQGIWAKENDERVFLFGKILRRLHLDEIPQIINILKGELSFIGPRPEQAHIVEELKKYIPFFEIRHIISPGITGWAQVNYKYVRSIEESKTKLEYDLYYLKNRGILLDIIIFMKTIFNI